MRIRQTLYSFRIYYTGFHPVNVNDTPVNSERLYKSYCLVVYIVESELGARALTTSSSCSVQVLTGSDHLLRAENIKQSSLRCQRWLDGGLRERMACSAWEMMKPTAANLRRSIRKQNTPFHSTIYSYPSSRS